MKTKISFIFGALLVFQLFSCQPSEKQKEQVSYNDSLSVEEISESHSVTINDREPTDDEIREFGMIIGIEDAGYPMYILNIEFPERKMQHTFSLNIEAITLTNEQLNNLDGKYITFYYLSNLENDLVDILLNNKTLLGEYAPETKDPEWKKVSGKLSGAEEETMGDLPGEISITDKNGTNTVFEYFVTPEMVKANGKTVTAYYTFRSVDDIKYIKPSDN